MEHEREEAHSVKAAAAAAAIPTAVITLAMSNLQSDVLLHH